MRRLLWFAPLVLLIGCELKTVTETVPSEPTSVGTLPPTPAPTPTPVPTPTPQAPEPNPNPNPEPSSPPSQPSGSCKLPARSNDNPCPRLTGGEFVDNIERALENLTAKQPELFDFNDITCGNCWRIRNHGKYVNAMLNQMANQGVCSHWNGEEMQLKVTNDWSENYDIMTFDGYVRRGSGSYRATCQPAAF
jgi:hypothetical protein